MRRRRWVVVPVLLGIGLAIAGLTLGPALGADGPERHQQTGTALVDGEEVAPRAGADHGVRADVMFEDDFSGTTLDGRRWNTCHWWDEGGCTISSNNELEWYLPSQVQVGGGALHLVAEEEAVTGSDETTYPYRSGMVTTGPPDSDTPARFAFTYGKVEARLNLPSGRGLWPALWLLPANRRSRPEIDVLEVIGQDPRRLMMHLHPADRGDESLGRDVRTADLAAGWHTVGIDWEPRSLTWLVDGRPVWRVRGSKVPSEPMYLVLNLAVGGEYPGPPDDATRFPASFDIDYVRVVRGQS